MVKDTSVLTVCGMLMGTQSLQCLSVNTYVQKKMGSAQLCQVCCFISDSGTGDARQEGDTTPAAFIESQADLGWKGP